MYKKLLYLTEFEEFYLDVLSCVLKFKKVGAEEIIIVHVLYATELPKIHEGYILKVADTLRHLLNTKAQQAVRLIENAGIKARTRIEIGIPYREILKVADEEKVDLIVAGRERKGFFGEVLVGSITDRIIKYGHIPVYIHKFPGTYGAEKEACTKFCEKLFSRVLYPTDWSDCARYSLKYLKGLKDAGIEEVIVAHVMDEKAMNLQPLEKFKEFERVDREKLQQVKEELEKEGFKVKTSLTVGNPRAELIKVASLEDISLIVMGSHGKGRVEGILWGSVSRNVAEYSDRPMILVKGNLK
jgi:nucleotide-binding universal stress UspA family protein